MHQDKQKLTEEIVFYLKNEGDWAIRNLNTFRADVRDVLEESPRFSDRASEFRTRWFSNMTNDEIKEIMSALDERCSEFEEFDRQWEIQHEGKETDGGLKNRQ